MRTVESLHKFIKKIGIFMNFRKYKTKFLPLTQKPRQNMH